MYRVIFFIAFLFSISLAGQTKKEYKNSLRQETFTFKKPQNWIEYDYHLVKHYSPISEKKTKKVYFYITAIQNKKAGKTIDSAVDFDLKNYGIKSGYSNFSRTKMPSNLGEKIIVSGTYRFKFANYTFVNIYYFKNKILYKLSYAGRVDLYSKYFNEVATSIDSFKILD